MERIFWHEKLNQGDIVSLGADDYHHLVRVLRLRPGQEFNIVDSEARVFLAVFSPKQGLGKQDSSPMMVEILKATNENNETPYDVKLYQGLCKQERFELILQKSTELGCLEIQPCYLQRCQGSFLELKKQVEKKESVFSLL